MNETDKKVALEAFKKAFPGPGFEWKWSDEQIQELPEWGNWLRSWQLATQARDDITRKELRKYLSSPIAAEDVIDGIRQLAQLARTWEDNCNDATQAAYERAAQVCDARQKEWFRVGRDGRGNECGNCSFAIRSLSQGELEAPAPVTVEATQRAIEFAEYLAKDVEHLKNKRNALYKAIEELNESEDEWEDTALEKKYQAEQELSEAWRALDSSIYEFRKRAERCVPAAPKAEKP